MNSLNLERDVLATFADATNKEWLVTNGLGGYASSTVSNCNTRRYHGLLVAALRPPVERIVTVAKLDVTAVYRNQVVALATNEFGDAIDPNGYQHLDSFRLEGQMPVWTWRVGDALIEQRVWMTNGKNTTYVTYAVIRASDLVDLEITPLCTYRDYHSQSRGEHNYFVSPVDGGVKIDAHWGAHPYRILIENGQVEITTAWYWNFKHRVETERGLDDAEDLFRPGIIRARLRVGESTSVVLTAESDAALSAAQSLRHELARQNALLQRVSTRTSSVTEQLVLAADQYIVERRDAEGNNLGKTIIAGYPWFADWGRDTMIALPGLTLATGRFEDAASILRTFAKFVSEGMLPNRFPDAGETPEYNTVDATLWYFVAIDEYFRATNDLKLLTDLYPVLREIVEWHLRGTRFGIHVDADDGLLLAGEHSAQLTWMDAKIGDWVVTPRIGKPVEINALWYNALVIMKGIAELLRDAGAVRGYAALAERAIKSFDEKYWSGSSGHLYDVIHGTEGELQADGKRYDASLRPNQLFAVSLRHSLLNEAKARAVVDVCARELWTPVGMRSLAPRDPRYAGRYAGSPLQRDAVYHQGTAWSWLLGPFAIAHFRAHGNAKLAMSYLEGMRAHLSEACSGQISEIFDGDAPFTSRGCFAQAWGVAELLRAGSYIHEVDQSGATSIEHAKKKSRSGNER